jgi:hypothetical protein
MSRTQNKSPFAGTFVPTPRNAAHRRSMLVDAMAYLDMQAVYSLVIIHHATVNEVSDAVAQTDHTADEVGQALEAWIQAGETRLSTRDRGHLITTLTQPSLVDLLELS